MAREERVIMTKITCPNCGTKIVINVNGRKRKDISVLNVYDAYEAHGGIRPAARQLGLPPGTVHTILKREGLLRVKE